MDKNTAELLLTMEIIKSAKGKRSRKNLALRNSGEDEATDLTPFVREAIEELSELRPMVMQLLQQRPAAG